MTDKEFAISCRELNEKLKKLPADYKEAVTEETAAKAVIIVKNMLLDGIGDALLFAAALNALNAYVKQSPENKKEPGYFFKGATVGLTVWLAENPCKELDLEVQQDQGMTLLVAEICGLQFSFHQVPVKQEFLPYMAKDLEHPRLKWDGIRKQRCGETVFAFAMNNTYGRGYKMLDGSSFEEGMATLLEDYKNGTKTMADLKKAVYRPAAEAAGAGNEVTAGENTGSGTEASGSPVRTRIPAAGEAVYPFRSRPSASLYESEYRDFAEKVRSRKLVPFLKERYEEGYGSSLSTLNYVEWKYAFEAVLHLLEAGGCSEDTGVRVEYIRGKNTETLFLILTGKLPEGKTAVGITELLSWERMHLIGTQDVVSYADNTDFLEVEAIHPSSLLNTFVNYLVRGVRDPENYIIRTAVWFYDAVLEYGTDIVTGFPKAGLATAPVFYADEKEKLTEHIDASMHGTCGREALEQIRKNFGGDASRVDFNQDILYAKQLLYRAMEKDERFLVIVDGRSKTGKTRMVRELTDALTAGGRKCFVIDGDAPLQEIPEGTEVLVWDGMIPEKWEPEMADWQLIFYDPFLVSGEDKARIIDFREQAEAKRIPVYSHSLLTAFGFKDMGGGNNWLIRHFTIGVIQPQDWDPESYSIKVVDSEKEYSPEEGIANVRVTNAVHAGPDGEGVVFEGNARRKLYQALSKGTGGVNLLIEDPALKARIGRELDNARNRYQWIERFVSFYQGDTAKLLEAQEEVFRHSTVRGKYESAAKKGLGESAWKKLDEESRDWILSALLSYNDLREYDPLLDFSGVVVQICKAVENVLSGRLAEDYVNWAKQEYAEGFMKHLPQTLVEECDGGMRVVSPGRITLGSFSFVMGMDRFGNAKYPEDVEKFKVYAVKSLFAEEITDPEPVMSELCRIIDHIRVNYRNKAAHSDTMSMVEAGGCIDYCIRKERKLGVILDWMRR